jgi:hypothetical protein
MPIRAKTRRPGFDETEILELDRPDDVTPDGADASERDGRTDHDREPDERISPLPYDATAFPDGVSSGDVTQNSAVLWARASSLGQLTFQISPYADFRHVVATRVATVGHSLLPAKVEVVGLHTDQRY